MAQLTEPGLCVELSNDAANARENCSLRAGSDCENGVKYGELTRECKLSLRNGESISQLSKIFHLFAFQQKGKREFVLRRRIDDI
ncbi:hypothetical protein CEXT_455521 [Caerostris extrusa]|uniref:Uncharacterized protein n=1 Tax=Caerostris extrusa TaxID=172846 RepID=A0AAV4UCT8_CAEEX|nr:hypothetical protein CEXT_455521 [Caerostris extrusa]